MYFHKLKKGFDMKILSKVLLVSASEVEQLRDENTRLNAENDRLRAEIAKLSRNLITQRNEKVASDDKLAEIMGKIYTLIQDEGLQARLLSNE